MKKLGFDFGNWYTFPCYIRGDNPNDRAAGTPVDLIPPNKHYGYPSTFFYSDRARERCLEDEARGRSVTPLPWCGDEAERGRAMPLGNRVRNLKRHIDEPLVLDSWQGSYDDAITLCIQYMVREANKVLATEEPADPVSNRISLAYPVRYTNSERQRLKDLAEQATLEDGTHVEVVGMIAEPAAAALDYLLDAASKTGVHEKETVLVYDLGAGTFDVAIVTAYPEGRKRADGSTYYYDIEMEGGIRDLGGSDFDACMTGLLSDSLGANARNVSPDTLRRLAVTAKEALTDDDVFETEIILTTGEEAVVEVTREQFEQAASGLVQKTVDEVKRVLENYGGASLDHIVLTGGASQMPMVIRMLQEGLPAYRDRIRRPYRPSKAIAYGAARYGTPVGKTVMQRVTRDLGIELYHNGTDNRFIDTYIKAGTELPHTGAWMRSFTRNENQTHRLFEVFEAKTDTPDRDQPDRDYRAIMSVNLDLGGAVPKGTPSEARLILDENGLLRIEARDPSKPGNPPVHNECTLILH